MKTKDKLLLPIRVLLFVPMFVLIIAEFAACFVTRALLAVTYLLCGLTRQAGSAWRSATTQYIN